MMELTVSKADNGGREGGGEATGQPWPRILSYWRIISAEAYDDATKAEVIKFVRATTSTMPEWQRAISGDADAAIGMVMHCKAPTSIGARVDFPMTVLLSCAFDDPGAALVLSNKLSAMPIEPRLRTKLATSWQVASLLLSLRLSMRKIENDTATATLPLPKTTNSNRDPRVLSLGSELPLPFKAEDISPLAWWRSLPSGAFGEAERLFLLTILEQMVVLHADDEFTAALNGDQAAAIGVAFSLMPIERMNLQVDIAMTALLRCVLERNTAATLVLAQVLGLTDLGHPFATELATSWLAYGRHFSENPRKFSKAATVLLAAFRERRRDGGDA
jgi:hypothetical protein